LRVERFTLNVPDRCIGHRACPHIWSPQPAWTARRALVQVRWVNSPVARTWWNSVSVPFFGSGGSQSVSTGWQALGLVGVKKPGAQISCLSPYLDTPPTSTVRPVLGLVRRVKSPVAETPCLSPYLVPGRLSNVTLRRPHCGDRTTRCQRSRYWQTEQTRSL